MYIYICIYIRVHVGPYPGMPWFMVVPKRSVGRPRMRWEDDLAKIAGEECSTRGPDLNMWQLLKAGYIDKLY